jgi:HK97 family phage major capsid protein
MRKSEIEKRLAEIKTILSGTEACDVSALETEVRALKAEQAEIDGREKRQAIAAGIMAGQGNPIPKTGRSATAVDPYDTVEYRESFMNFCKTGAQIEKRIDAYTDTTTAAAMIPTTIMNEIVKKMTAYGNLFAKVRKLNVKGGVNIPIASVKPTATWITQATPSDRKAITASTSVSFSYIGLECKVAVSLLAETVSLPMFESLIIDLVVEAMTKALDIAIAKGAGTTEPLGFTVDPRVPAGQIITLAAADFVTWEGWKKKVFAKIPLAYRAGGAWVMAAGTWDGYIDGMVDANGQPIARVNYGLVDGPAERFGGKEVILVEDDVMGAYEAAANGDVVAAFIKLTDYAINSNLQMQLYRWLDHDLNQWVDKALLICDGKLVDPNGVVLVKKGA